MSTQIINARITRTRLGAEDHGIFTFYVWVDRADGGGQAFGGLGMDTPATGRGLPPRTGTAFSATLIIELLRILEVPCWEDLPRTPCRVKAEGGLLVGIGNFMKEQWLEPKVLYAAMMAAGLEKEKE